MRPLLSIIFPPRFGISKNIGHPTSGSRGKNTDTQTHRQTNMDKSTYRKHWPRGKFCVHWSLKFKTTKLNKF